MKFKSKIISLAKNLEKRGFTVKLPIECMNNEPKVIASRCHIDCIVDSNANYLLN